MIEFLEKNPKLTHTQSLVLTYPRTVQITFGNYPYPEDIHNFIVEIKNKIDKGMSYATKVKASMTKFEEFIDHPLTKKFINYCINKHQLSHPELFEYFYDTKYIENAWGNEIKKGDYVENHIHTTYHGILYLTEGSSLILPELNIQVMPKPGDYYFFPPYIYHYVNKSESDKSRYNLILNINLKIDWEKNKRVFEKFEK